MHRIIPDNRKKFYDLTERNDAADVVKKLDAVITMLGTVLMNNAEGGKQ